ncbi:PQQ-dependent sugar dehydrogenase [Peribacillus frigoritolerans]|uniref:PQQ-dependent sugar dehydrogenase n=1 Tax=Peribacillus frigoritolerans TaxID=450367 RepID=UPI00197ED0F4|nr:PQQ-dependent sugar dehydrogenase [Peribacillus frigoritolerans]
MAFYAYVAYVANEIDDTVSVVETKNNTVVGSPITVGSDPKGIAITRNGKFVYVANFSDDTVSVIDTKTNTLAVRSIEVGNGPVGIAITPNGLFTYVTNSLDDTVSVIQMKTNTVVGSPIGVGTGPSAIAIAPNGRAYVTNSLDNTVSVIDTRTNIIIGSPITVGAGPGAIAITPSGRFVYVANSLDDTISVIDTRSNKAVGNPITVGAGPGAIAIIPSGRFAYVANNLDDTVSVIDTRTNTVVGSPITVGAGPGAIAITRNGRFAYVTNRLDDTVSVIDTKTNIKTGSPIPVEGGPIGIGITPIPIAVSEQSQSPYQIAARGLTIPWALEIYNDTFYVTERPGKLAAIKGGTVTRQSLALSKPIRVIGEGGLLGFVLGPNFVTNQTAYLYHTYEVQGKIYNRVISVKLSGTAWIEQKELLAGIPGGSTHNGGRIAIGPDERLYVTTGEAGVRALAQDLNSLGGKILRMNLDGTIPADNPFPESYIYSYGHRNPQGLAWDHNGQLYSSEHGPSGENGWRGHDEINKILPGKNYGWPLIFGDQQRAGMESPLFQSGDSTWAPSGLAYHNGSLYVAGLRGAQIRKFNLLSKQESIVLSGLGRLRNITFKGNTAYVLTNNRIESGKSDDWLISTDRL